MKNYNSYVFILLADAMLFWSCAKIPWVVWNYHVCWKGDSTYCYDHKGESEWANRPGRRLEAVELLCQNKRSSDKPAFQKVCEDLWSYLYSGNSVSHDYSEKYQGPLPPKIADEFVIDVNERREERDAPGFFYFYK